MVAETLTERKPRKRQGFQPKIPLGVKLQIRGLYLVQQLSAVEIGAKLKVSPRSVENICHREGWTKLKRGVKERAEAASIARETEQIAEIVDSVAIQTAALAVQTLDKASRTLQRDDETACRDLQALSQSAKNFNGMFREARNLNAERNAERSGNTIIFLRSAPRVGDSVQRPEVNVTPAAPVIELPPSPTPTT